MIKRDGCSHEKVTWIMIVGGIPVLLVVLYLLFKPTTADQYNEFAQCLTEKGAIMYGTDWCIYCKCLSAGVQGYPTWRINGENYPGLQQLSRLAQLSGCELK